MASSSEGDKGFGEGKVEKSSVSTEPSPSKGPELPPEVLPAQYFTSDDPQRAERLSQVDGEAGSILSSVGLRLRRSDGMDPRELRNLHADARQRSQWNNATADVFKGVLRLGNRVPPRSRRVL